MQRFQCQGIAQFAVLHRALSPDGQLCTTFLLQLPQGVASGPEKKPHKVDVGMFARGDVEFFRGSSGPLVVHWRVVEPNRPNGVFHKRVSFFFKRRHKTSVPRVCSVAHMVILRGRRRITAEIWHFGRRKRCFDRRSGTHTAKNPRDLFDAKNLLVCVDLFLGQVASDDGVEFGGAHW